MTSKGWTNVEHFQQGSNQLDDWGITGVPHVAIIDTKGNITCRGHPATFDLENLLAEYATGNKVFEAPAPLAEGEFGCEEGHKMNYHDKPIGSRGDGGLGCDRCKKCPFPCEEGYWTCGQCDYDICATCEPKRD